METAIIVIAITTTTTMISTTTKPNEPNHFHKTNKNVKRMYTVKSIFIVYTQKKMSLAKLQLPLNESAKISKTVGKNHW